MTAIVLAALAPVLWGTSYVVSTELLPGFHPFVVATLRALPAGLVLLIAGRRLPHGIWWWRSFVLGALNIGLFFGLLLFATYRLPGGLVATTGAIQPVAVLLLSWLLFKERPAAVALVASATGILGVGLLFLGPEAPWDPVGVAAAVGAALSMATGIVLTRHWGRPVPLAVFTGWQLTGGALIIGVLALVFSGPLPRLTLNGAFGVGWLTIMNTAVAYLLWFRGIERLPKTWQLSILGLLSPVVATILGRFILNQTLSPLQLAGMGLVFLSVTTAQSGGMHKSVSNP